VRIADSLVAASAFDRAFFAVPESVAVAGDAEAVVEGVGDTFGAVACEGVVVSET
jgi:hypothetical protein